MQIRGNDLELHGEPIAVPPGIVLSPRVRARWSLDHDTVGALGPGQTVNADVLIEYSNELGRYELRTLQLSGLGNNAPEITGALLRTVRVQFILQVTALKSLSLLDHLSVWDPDNDVLTAAFADAVDFLGGDVAAALSHDGVSIPAEHMLAHVAVIYRAAEISSQNPGQQVAEAFQLQRRTAANWISRSRLAGYFDRVIGTKEISAIAKAWADAIVAASHPGIGEGDGDGVD